MLNDGAFTERSIGEPTNYERETRIVVISYPYEFYNLKIDERDILVFHHNLLDIPDIYQEIINCIKICRNVYVLDISMKPSEYRSEIRKLGIKANGEGVEMREGRLTEYLLGLRKGEIGVKRDGEA